MRSHPSNNAKLKALMNDAPMTAEAHSLIVKKRVEARRLAEERNEVASLDRADTLGNERDDYHERTHSI